MRAVKIGGFISIEPNDGSTTIIYGCASCRHLFEIKGEYPENQENIDMVLGAINRAPDPSSVASVARSVEREFGI